ncbi:hypothetical protein EXN66_Car017648 [Channa argus]|uniref:Uncharacterized protein n=1 Tax=Channa argus TaxID=215402 RepID=A0A6G1QGY8_CHAAH|nr:hypothetical protein EXN66_Car017648 [Channa argus]
MSRKQIYYSDRYSDDRYEYSQTPGPDTSNSKAKVHLRHVISCAGLSDTVVLGVSDQRPLSEPAAHQYFSLAQGLAMLHYRGVQAVPIY